GAEEYKPKEYFYGKDERVLTLLELEEQMAKGDTKIINAKSLSIILCVGSRQEGRPYCSRICCGQAIKCALKLKEINPDLDIYIFYRDMRTYGFKEDYYRQAANNGVNFIRYDVDNEPQVEVVKNNNQSTFKITVFDPILEKNLTIDNDILALGVAVLPSSDNKEISKLYKIPLSQDGFFLEAHMKLRPVDFATDGIFLCGMAHFPKYVSESVSQANAAASRAATLLSKDKNEKIEVEPIVANLINEDACRGCGLCVALCPYGALEVRQTEKGRKVHVIDVACKGCGVCAATCYQHALTIDSFTDQQITAQMEAYLGA
ncbi:MAG: CoB--CoM heterodisulfide reductase iron-sulfur subunit A family protein, partial [Deltaproteobacteria bacterium]|nr:CoB--CoM heterodisulfide reductase iron-sulfur subunit A family protein [Deltaproteobacteria bacterium]